MRMQKPLPTISSQMAGEYQIRYKTAAVLRELRNKKHITQQRMADNAGIFAPSYSKYERAIHTPSLHMLFSFAKTLGVKPSEIIKQIEDTNLN